MKFTPLNMVLAAVVAYVVYQYFTKESMTNMGTIGTAIAVVVGIAVLGAMYMYATSK